MNDTHSVCCNQRLVLTAEGWRCPCGKGGEPHVESRRSDSLLEQNGEGPTPSPIDETDAQHNAAQ